jgi:hypothetical protein
MGRRWLVTCLRWVIRARILIADSVGLGKTLEAGVLATELIQRGRGVPVCRLSHASRLARGSCVGARHPDNRAQALDTGAGRRVQPCCALNMRQFLN